MATLQYSSLQDGGPDDLPRTLKREREAREREAREREARERETLQRDSLDAPVGRSDGADLGAPGHPGAHGAADRHGLDLPDVRPVHLDDVLAPGDLVVTVCDAAHEELAGRDAMHWSVPDPVRAGTDAAFDAALAEIDRRIRDAAPRLVAA